MPQAIRWLWPMTTPGTPAKLKPDTSNGQLVDSVWQCSPTWYQTPGRLGARCGSFASSGLPVVVSAPDTTHELEPTPSIPPPSRSGTAPTACRAASTTAWPPDDDSAASSPVVAVLVAAAGCVGARPRAVARAQPGLVPP